MDKRYNKTESGHPKMNKFQKTLICACSFLFGIVVARFMGF